ncbi:hypothetical protein N9X73_06725 [Porticoccaceae bacterium]|jgi:hypothetical protein|nr:hypothetical protein [Porticoccaceae bacterium]
MTKLIRSNKYKHYSDQKVLRLFSDSPKGEMLHFLTIEIDVRELRAEADRLSKVPKPKAKRSLSYYLFYLVMFVLIVIRFGGKIF